MGYNGKIRRDDGRVKRQDGKLKRLIDYTPTLADWLARVNEGRAERNAEPLRLWVEDREIGPRRRTQAQGGGDPLDVPGGAAQLHGDETGVVPARKSPEISV